MRRRRGTSVKKIGCLVVVGLVVLFIVISAIVPQCNKPPTPENTKYAIETPSRVYLCDHYDNVTGVLYLTEYYTLEKGEWKYYSTPDYPLEISEAFGNFRVTARGPDDMILPAK